jgi:cytochrome c553
MSHECQYAKAARIKATWQTDQFGLTVCALCHAPKEEEPQKAAPTKILKEK